MTLDHGVHALVARASAAGRWTVTVDGRTAEGRLRNLQTLADDLAGGPVTLVWPTDIAERHEAIAAAEETARRAQTESARLRAELAAHLRGERTAPAEALEDIGAVLGGLSRQRVDAILRATH